MMRPLLAALLLTIAMPAATAATTSNAIALHYEQGANGHATGISYSHQTRGVTLGFSTNRISTAQPLEMQNPTTLYPVYAFASIAFRMPVSPYLEFGVDVGNYLFDENSGDSSRRQGGDETLKLNRMDTYGAIGVKTSLRRTPIDFSLYLKGYTLTYSGAYANDETQNHGTFLTMGGANVIFNF